MDNKDVLAKEWLSFIFGYSYHSLLGMILLLSYRYNYHSLQKMVLKEKKYNNIKEYVLIRPNNKQKLK